MTTQSVFRTAAAVTIGLSLVAGSVGAYANDLREVRTDEARILSSAKISMSQALAAAGQATGGKAVGTDIEDEDGTVHFEVTILKDNTRQKVLVDTQTGLVVKTITVDNDDERAGDD